MYIKGVSRTGMSWKIFEWRNSRKENNDDGLAGGQYLLLKHQLLVLIIKQSHATWQFTKHCSISYLISS